MARKPRVLVAEDDSDDFALIKEALEEEAGVREVEWVKDGDALLERLRRGPAPDLVLLDLNMPRADGRAALRRMKGDPDLRRIPVVVVTASTSERDVDEAYDLGASSFIPKPRDFDEFLRLIRALRDYWFSIVLLPGKERARREAGPPYRELPSAQLPP